MPNPPGPAAPLGPAGPENPAGKEALRRHFRRLRRESLPDAAAGILTVARRELSTAEGRLGLWWPIGAEPDLRPLADELESGAPGRLALPAVLPWPAHGPGLRLLYLPWCPGDPLVPDACGIPAPQALSTGTSEPLRPAQLALLLVPALAIDRSGLRLGSGGGWYDRLRADPAWRAVPAVAVLPAACVSAAPLPRDPWDVPFDGWLDESGLHFVASS